MTRPEAAACPLCGAEGSREVFRFLRPRPADPTGRPTEALYGRAGRLVRCVECSLVRQDPPIEAPYEEAEDTVYLEEEGGIRETFLRTLDQIEHRRPHRGRILDVGCGPGLLLDEARRRGWEPVGVEPSAWGAAESRGRDLDVRHGTLDETDFPASSFTAVVASDVVEHVPDPLAFARRTRELLEPEGVVLLTTPNVESFAASVLRRWWWSILPGHLFYFSPSTLRLLLERAGFRVLEITTHPKTFSVGYYADRFSGYRPIVGRIARTVARTLGGSDRLVTPDLRDRLAAIAERPTEDRRP